MGSPGVPNHGWSDSGGEFPVTTLWETLGRVVVYNVPSEAGSPCEPLRAVPSRPLRDELLTGDASYPVANARVMIDLLREIYH